MAKVEETRHWITEIRGVRSKTARTFPAGLKVTLPARFPMTYSWREWFGELQITSEEVRRKLRVKNYGLV
jgi:hypothetical protein